MATLKSEFDELKPAKEKTIPEYYLARAKHYAEIGRDYWLVDGITDEKRYYNKFDEETKKMASAFFKLGLRKGGVVIYMSRDLCKQPLMLTGVWRANGVMRASYPDDDVDTILHRVKESQVKFIVCEEDGVSVCQEVADKANWKIHIITVNRSSLSKHSLQQFLEEDDGSDCPELLITEDDPAVILCTSGTTGMPKGAVHLHRTLLIKMRFMERMPFTLDKPNLMATKATHISGTTMPFMVLAVGKTTVAVSSLTRDHILNAAARYKPGLIFAFPTFLVAMTAPEASHYDFSSVEIILTGGVPITPAIRKELLKLPNTKDIVSAYGLTECMTATTSAILKDDGEREVPTIRDIPDFSVGKPYPGTLIQIRDPETLQVVGEDIRGEICIKAPGLFHCYLNNPEATANAFVDGYLRTGDIGYYDSKGFIYVVDRLKEIFKYYNDHISPSELEDVIGKHPKVREVCVIGVADPGGHVPRAFLTLHPNSGSNAETKKEILEFANSKLAPYKQLRGGVFIVEELPKGKTGKVTRQLVATLPAT